MKRNDIRVRRGMINENRMLQYRDFDGFQSRYNQQQKKRSMIKGLWLVLFVLTFFLIVYFFIRSFVPVEDAMNPESRPITYTQTKL